MKSAVANESRELHTNGESKRTRAARLSKHQRRAQLLNCALALSADKGLGNVSHSDLAARAEVSVATTFHYYSTREMLTEEVALEVSRFLIEDFVEVRIEGPTDVTSDTISEMLLAFVSAMDEHPEYILIWMHWSAGVNGPTWAHYKEFQRKALQSLKRLLQLGVKNGSLKPELDCDVVSRVVLNTAFMLAQMKFGGEPQREIEGVVQSLVSNYITA